jgi:hypothetical protein
VFDEAVEQLAHWWNGSWGGTYARRDVWVELLDDGRLQVRWRGGEWTDRDGTLWTDDKLKAWWAVRELIGDGTEWKRVDHVTSVAHG